MNEAPKPEEGEHPSDMAARPLFSTAVLPAADRLAAWQDHVARLNSTTLLERPTAQTLALSVTWRLGPFVLTRNVMPRIRLLRDAGQRRRDGLDHWGVRIARGGTARVRARDGSFVVPARQPTVSSFADGYESEYEAGEWVTLIVPRAGDPAVSAALTRRGPGPLTGVAARLFGAHLLRLSREIEGARESDLSALAEGLRGLLRGALLHPDPRQGAMDAGPILLERVRAIIAQNIGSALLDPGRLAKQIGVSRSVLYRAMQPEGGVARFVKQQRLDWVRTALADPALAHHPAAALAARAGFFDPSSFHRAFRAAFGCTPRERRAEALLGRPVRSATPRAATGDLLSMIGVGAAA